MDMSYVGQRKYKQRKKKNNNKWAEKSWQLNMTRSRWLDGGPGCRKMWCEITQVIFRIHMSYMFANINIQRPRATSAGTDFSDVWKICKYHPFWIVGEQSELSGKTSKLHLLASSCAAASLCGGYRNKQTNEQKKWTICLNDINTTMK